MSHPQPLPVHDPSAITLYGAPLAVISPGDYNVRLSATGVTGLKIELKNGTQSYLALIYGYAFDGHCYKLDRPTIMIVNSAGDDAVGCDYNDFGDGVTATQKYKMWVVNKFDRTAQIDIVEGPFEELVLEANLPGRRNPNSYASNMMLSHRSGRLSE